MNTKTDLKRFEATERYKLSRNLTPIKKYAAPKGLNYFAFQEASVDYALLGTRTLYADPPGIGKTIQALAHVNARGSKRILILCPASLVNNWARETKKWLIAQLKVVIFNPKTFDPKSPPDVLIMSYGHTSALSSVALVTKHFQYDHCIIDEFHYLKELKTLRTKHVLAKNGLALRASVIDALSGTPLVNRPMELYPIVKSLCPEAIDNMDQFTYGLKFCGGWKSPWGWDFTGASNLKELGTRLRSHLMIRREKDLLLTELPKKLPPNIVYLDQTKTVGKIVRRLAKFDESLVTTNVTVGFEDLSEARRELGVEKIKQAVAYIRTQLDGGHDKIVVFAHHHEVIDALKEQLIEYMPAVLTGRTPSHDKQAQVDRFQQHPGCRLFIGSIGAASVGHTLTKSSYVIFVEFSYVPGENEQAIDRTHRIGQTETVQADFLTFENSLDERILRLNIQKSLVIDEVYSN